MAHKYIIYLRGDIHGEGNGRGRLRVIEKRDRVRTDNPVGNNRFDKEIFSDFACNIPTIRILLWRDGGGVLHTLRMICVSRIVVNAYIYYIGTCAHRTYLLSLYFMYLSCTSLSLRDERYIIIIMSAIIVSIDCDLIGTVRLVRRGLRISLF